MLLLDEEGLLLVEGAERLGAEGRAAGAGDGEADGADRLEGVALG